jgi:Pla-1/cef family extracellular lipase
MKKLALSLPLAIAMSLSGCSGDDTTLREISNAVEQNNETVTPIARIIFDPTAGRLSVPNDLLFTGTTDGTLEMPDEVAARAAMGHADYSDPGQALGVLDGWSTQNPFVLGIDYPAGYSLGTDSAGMPGAVRIFEVKMGGEEGCESVPRGAACAPVAELTFGVDFVTSASGNSVAVAPLKPLKPSTTYIVATTDMLKDDAGRSIGPSSTYELVKQNINTHPLGTPSQLALQGAVNSYEGVLAALGVDTETITYTAAMTTQSVGDVIMTVKTMMVANMSLNPAATPSVAVQDTSLSVGDVMAASGLITPDHPLYMAYASADLYQGSVTVPYYLSIPSMENPLAPTNTPWKAACDSGVTVQGYAAQVGDAFPYPADTQPLSANDAMCMALSGGSLRDFTNPETGYGIDRDRHMTKYNLIPRMNAMMPLEVQMTVPDLPMVNMVRQAMGLPALDMPEMGFPVVILQHGVGSRKEDMLAAVGSLNVSGFATVAIDLPLHSSRGFDVNGDGVDDINASTVSPTHYFNLANLPVTRDNVRQGTSDLMALRLGLNFTQGAPINPTNVHFLGLSLGAINGTNFLAITNTPNLEAALGAPGVDNLLKVESSVLASPGGGLANLLVESPAFGPLVQAGILSAAGTALSDEFNAFMAAGVPECLAYIDSSDAYGACAIQIFGLGLAQTGQEAKLAEISGLVAQFVFAAQTVTDAGDPSNLARFVQANGSALLLTELIGDGMENLSDQVVPNQTANTPIGGTEPLIRALGLTNSAVTNTTQGDLVDGVPSKIQGVVRFTKGHHGSILVPSANSAAPDGEANARVTAEMQSQAVSFFLSGGRAVLINDGEYVQGHE